MQLWSNCSSPEVGRPPQSASSAMQVLKAVFTKTHVQKIILTGNRNPVSKLWQIKLRQSDNNLENLQTLTTIHRANVYELKKQADIITYLH
jgi:hypothetical protein